MLIQRAGTGTLPPPGFTTPPWNLLKEQWDKTPLPATPSVSLGPASLVVGHDDSEADDFDPSLEHDVEGHEFGWDNESPRRSIDVGAFKAEWRPVTNKEFLEFLRGSGKGLVSVPGTWENEGEVCAHLWLPIGGAHVFSGQDHVWSCPDGSCAELACFDVVRRFVDIREEQRRSLAD